MGFWSRGRAAIARGLNLDLTHSQKHYAKILEQYVKPGAEWLEVGCGRHVVPDWAMPVENAIDAEALAQAACMETQDFVRAYKAFAARQTPVFQGN